MGNILNDILGLMDVKHTYKPKEIRIIKKSLAHRCDAVIQKAKGPFIDAIDKINDL